MKSNLKADNQTVKAKIENVFNNQLKMTIPNKSWNGF